MSLYTERMGKIQFIVNAVYPRNPYELCIIRLALINIGYFEKI